MHRHSSFRSKVGSSTVALDIMLPKPFHKSEEKKMITLDSIKNRYVGDDERIMPTIIQYQFVQYLLQFIGIDFHVIASELTEYGIDVNGQRFHR